MGKTYKVLPMWFKKTDKYGQQYSSFCKKISDSEILCIICDKKIACASKGFAALTQHVSTSLHIENAAVKLKPAQLLLKPREQHNNESVQVIAQDKTKSPVKTINLFHSKEADMKAELIWALKSVQCNMAAANSDDLKFVFPAMFPSMTGLFNMGRTKLSYLITEALGPYFRKELLSDIGQSFFTLVFDETTNNADKKELQFQIRYWSNIEDQIVCKHLQSIFIGHATAADIVRDIRNTLDHSNLSLTKLIMLATDGPNVNKKVQNLLNNVLIEERNCGLLDIGTCNLHVVNNAFLKGLNEYGDNVCELVTDIYYFFKKFPSRWEDFVAIQVKVNVPAVRLVKHVSSRWLTAGPACKRLLQQWPAIEEYFLNFVPSNAKQIAKTSRFQHIVRCIKSADVKTEINFVIESAELFSTFQSFFLNSMPLIHLLYDEFIGILRKLKGRISKADSNANELISVENLLRASEVECGPDTSAALKVLKEKDKLEALYKIQRHYMAAHNYLVNQFKRSNILKYCICMQPEKIKTDRSLKFVGHLANSLPFLELDAVAVKDEWRVLQSEVTDNSNIQRVDHFWRNILCKKNHMGELKYPLLNKLIKISLSLSHGNGDVERGFSISKRILAEEKSNMSERMLNERLIIKDSLTKYKHVGEVPISKELLKMAFSAHRSYENFLEEQKKKKEIALKESQERKEKIENEKQREEEIKNRASSIKQLEEKAKLAAIEKKSNQESADSLLKEANQRLKLAIEKNDINGIRIAQGMIEGAEKLREKERTVEKKEEKLNHIVHKRKSNLIDKFITKKPRID